MMRAPRGEDKRAVPPALWPVAPNLKLISGMAERSKFLSLGRLLAFLIAICLLLYAADFVSLRAGIPRREKSGSITVHTMYAVKLKNGRTEYDDGGDQIVSCSNSLFPQLGLEPCWYVRRHPTQQITIDSGNPNNPHIF
jgi:hypothetical protein